MTGRGAVGLATLTSVAAFLVALYLRLNAAYGPFHLFWHPADWAVLWELWRANQIAPEIVAEGTGLGAAAAAVPWLILGWRRWRQPSR
jgi:hypothetical protein